MTPPKPVAVTPEEMREIVGGFEKMAMREQVKLARFVAQYETLVKALADIASGYVEEHPVSLARAALAAIGARHE